MPGGYHGDFIEIPRELTWDYIRFDGELVRISELGIVTASLCPTIPSPGLALAVGIVGDRIWVRGSGGIRFGCMIRGPGFVECASCARAISCFCSIGRAINSDKHIPLPDTQLSYQNISSWLVIFPLYPIISNDIMFHYCTSRYVPLYHYFSSSQHHHKMVG